MISSLVVGVACMYVYFLDKHFIYLVLAAVCFVLAMACHQKLKDRVEELEKKTNALLESQNETNKFMVAQLNVNDRTQKSLLLQVDMNNEIKKVLMYTYGVKEDDLK